MATAILTTKLYVPPVRPTLVPRPRLTERLRMGLAGKLTLLAAPAGFGKTTLLAAWLADLVQPVAWLSLDGGDNDPSTFLRYLVAALQTVAPSVGPTLLALLQAPQPPPPAVLLTVLINDLAVLPQASILVLDDYHVLQAVPIHEAVLFLLDHLPPQLHLVIASRADPPLPLARLRGRGHLTELRAADLRFTPAEAAAFLTEVMQVPLGADDVAALETRTEGWIAGLQLAALAMRDQHDVTSFIRAFTGSNRFVMDYLVEEVFARQPSHLQTFLLQTAILDRMCAPLCDVVLGIAEASAGARRSPSDSGHSAYAQSLLEELERSNLFLVPLDDRRLWYRYHHLFGDVLRGRLLSGAPREDVDTLHRRASRWFEHQGLLPEAIHHALAASDFVQAARLIAQAAEPAMRVGAFATLLNWLAALPTEHVRAQPQLCLAYAWMLLGSPSLQVDVIERWVQDALRVLPADHPSAGTLAGEAAVLRAVIASVQEENARAIALSRQALEWLVRDSVWRSVAAMILGVSYQLLGDVAAARVALAEALRLSQAHGFHHIELIVRSHLAELAVLQGELDDAVTVYRQVLDQANALGYPQRGAVLAHGGLGQILYERNQLDAALEHLQAGITLYQQTGGAVRGALALYVLLARVYQVQGNPQRAFAALAEGEQLAHAAGGEALLPLIATWRARLQLAQGDKTAPTRWASDCGLSVADEHAGLPHPVPRDVEYTTLIRVYIAQGQSGAAVLLLERLLEAASKAGRTGSVIEILILQALTLQALDQTPQALATCERALRLATPAGYIRLFVDEGVPLRLLILDVRLRLEDRATELQAYVEKLLAAFPPAKGDAAFHIQNPQAAIQNLVEPLTERELEILRLVAAGASNREIAEQVIVTVGTVKKHLNNIFSKLEVQSRTQALVRARELGLL